MFRFSLFYDLIQQFNNLRVAFCIATRKRRGEESKTLVAALVKEVFVLHAVILRRVERIEALQGWRIQIERVGLNAIYHQTHRRH